MAWRAFYVGECDAAVVAARIFEASAGKRPERGFRATAHEVQFAAAVKLALVLLAACASPDVGTYGTSTVTIGGVTGVYGAIMQPSYPDFDGKVIGWSISFVQGATPGSACDGLPYEVAGVGFGTTTGVASSTLPDVPLGSYDIGSATSGEVNADVIDSTGAAMPSGTVTVTEFDDSHVTGTFDASGTFGRVSEHVFGSFAANRCFD